MNSTSQANSNSQNNQELIPEYAKILLNTKSYFGYRHETVIFNIWNGFMFYFIGFFGLLITLSIYASDKKDLFSISEYKIPIIFNCFMILLVFALYKNCKNQNSNYKIILSLKYIILSIIPFFTLVQIELLNKNLLNFFDIIEEINFEILMEFFYYIGLPYVGIVVVPLSVIYTFFYIFIPWINGTLNTSICHDSCCDCRECLFCMPTVAAIIGWFLAPPMIFAIIAFIAISSVAFQFIFMFIDLPNIFLSELYWLCILAYEKFI